MTTINRDGYVFEVDIEKNLEYYKTHSLCECDNCKNYYTQIKGKFPELERLLSELGVDISRPDEICSIESNNLIEYLHVDYTVCGKVVTMGKYEIDIHDNIFISIVVTDGFASQNNQKGDYFTLSVYNMELPWVLNKPFPEPIQAAKGKRITEFFNRLKKQLDSQ